MKRSLLAGHWATSLGGTAIRQIVIALFGTAALSVACASGAMAADMPAQTYVKAPSMVAPAFGWSGFYIGGHAGADFRRNADATVDPADALTTTHFGPNLTNGFFPRSYGASGTGFVGGVQLGYNWQMQNFVFGVETDFSGSTAKAHQDIIFPGIPAVLASSAGTFDAKVLWFGTTRARVGVLLDPRVLTYATGGVAYGSVRRQFSFGFPAVGPIEQTFADHTDTSWGWTAGAGIEWAVADHVTIRGEYQFVRLDGKNSATNSTAGFCNTIPALSCNFNVNGQAIDNHTVTIGINYLFGGPIVARY
jgi:outer membrane immunogenic protein